jgi:hypothetical protein
MSQLSASQQPGCISSLFNTRLTVLRDYAFGEHVPAATNTRLPAVTGRQHFHCTSQHSRQTPSRNLPTIIAVSSAGVCEPPPDSC